MPRKYLIVLFFLAFAPPLAGQGLAFAQQQGQLQENGDPCPPECVTDSMEIVTWYPSPYNEYEELRLYPTQRDDNYCDNDKMGLMYYDDGGTPSFPEDDKIRVCKGISLGWQEIGRGTSGNYSTVSRPLCDSSSLGTIIFDTDENKPYVCTSGGVYKPLDSDYDKDGITDAVDANDNDFNDATALEADVASGQTFYARGGSRRTGTGVFGSPDFLKVKIYSNDDTFQVPAGVNSITVEVWGGGGGGGTGGSCTLSGTDGGAGGGGGGGYGKEVLSVTPGDTYAISIGTGGAADISGGTTYFKESSGGVLLSASGGSSGTVGSCNSGSYCTYFNSAGGNGGTSSASTNSSGEKGSYNRAGRSLDGSHETNCGNWGGYGGKAGSGSYFVGGSGGRGGETRYVPSNVFGVSGFAGDIPGGGGGGGMGYAGYVRTAGNGGKGRVIISYN